MFFVIIILGILVLISGCSKESTVEPTKAEDSIAQPTKTVKDSIAQPTNTVNDSIAEPTKTIKDSIKEPTKTEFKVGKEKVVLNKVSVLSNKQARMGQSDRRILHIK